MAQDIFDVNCVASLFKSWLRDLDGSIFPTQLQNQVVAEHPDSEEVPVDSLRQALFQLEPCNYYLVFASTRQLRQMWLASAYNKMTVSNLFLCTGSALGLHGDIFRWLVVGWDEVFAELKCHEEDAYRDAEYRAAGRFHRDKRPATADRITDRQNNQEWDRHQRHEDQHDPRHHNTTAHDGKGKSQGPRLGPGDEDDIAPKDRKEPSKAHRGEEKKRPRERQPEAPRKATVDKRSGSNGAAERHDGVDSRRHVQPLRRRSPEANIDLAAPAPESGTPRAKHDRGKGSIAEERPRGLRPREGSRSQRPDALSAHALHQASRSTSQLPDLDFGMPISPIFRSRGSEF